MEQETIQSFDCSKSKGKVAASLIGVFILLCFFSVAVIWALSVAPRAYPDYLQVPRCDNASVTEMVRKDGYGGSLDKAYHRALATGCYEEPGYGERAPRTRIQPLAGEGHGRPAPIAEYNHHDVERIEYKLARPGK